MTQAISDGSESPSDYDKAMMALDQQSMDTLVNELKDSRFDAHTQESVLDHDGNIGNPNIGNPNTGSSFVGSTCVGNGLTRQQYQSSHAISQI